MSIPKHGDTERPLVSVIMGVYNAERYLDQAVTSILLQEYLNLEFVIIDDGSTDESYQVLKRYAAMDSRIHLMRQSNRGPAAARNQGIRTAKGKYIAIMDADDVSEPNRLSKQLLFLEQHPGCVAVGSRLTMIDPDGESIAVEMDRPTGHEGILKIMLTGLGGIPNPAAMIRSADLKQVGGYDEAYPAAEDLDLWFRLSDLGELANLPEALHQYRLHDTSHGTTKLHLQNEWGRRAVISYYARRDEQPPETPLWNFPKPMTRAEHRMNWAWMSVGAGNRSGSLKHSWEAVKLQPTNWRLWYQWGRIRFGLTNSLRTYPKTL